MQFRMTRSIDEALDELTQWGDDGCLVAGGTDVVLQYRNREISPAALIHIERIEELRSVAVNGRTVIGALTTHHQLATNPDIAERHPALVRAAGIVGGWQTQAVGTLGGNICNASPAADTVPPLLVADAKLTLASTAGTRVVTVADFLTGRRSTSRRSDELLTSIDVDPLPAGSAETYLKVGRRSSMDVAVVGLALRLGLTDGMVTSARIATCSVAPTPRRVTAPEEILVGSRLEAEVITAAGHALAEASSPMDDARGSASYRRRVLPGLLTRAIEQCTEEAK